MEKLINQVQKYQLDTTTYIKKNTLLLIRKNSCR